LKKEKPLKDELERGVEGATIWGGLFLLDGEYLVLTAGFKSMPTVITTAL